VLFPSSVTPASGDLSMLASGNFVFVADGGALPLPTGNHFSNGKVFRLGAEIKGPLDADRAFELVPGEDITNLPFGGRPSFGDDAYGRDVTVITVGRPVLNPGRRFDAADNAYRGGAPDIAVFRFLIPVTQ
jgi:hypothetical protein